MEKVLITGGCGFVGHHVVEYFLRNTDWDIYVLDNLTYATSGFDRLREIGALGNGRVRVFVSDISKPISVGIRKECKDLDYILHLAAESHVDNSIVDPGPFIMSNVLGTMHVLDFARSCNNLKAFLYFSTDEVFGPNAGEEPFEEWARYNSTNPYAATKAGGEELSLSYMHTYKLPGFITHCMNIFGERQHPEKFIPLCMRKILADEVVMIHSTSDRKKSGSRFYIYAPNVANCIHWLLTHFKQRDKYNITSALAAKELTNLEVAQRIADILNKPLRYEMVDFHSVRPGHDLRYSIGGEKLKNMGYKMPISPEEAFRKTVLWTVDNQKWLYIDKK